MAITNEKEIPVSFSKNSEVEYNKDSDKEQGRVYFRKDGIFVDDFKYSVNTPATKDDYGIVKIADELEKNPDGQIIAPANTGVAASTSLVYNLINNISEVVVPSATTEQTGTVILKDSFDIDKDKGIIAPSGTGVAASPQLVYNTMASLKNYYDTSFSEDFIKKDDNKIYINWLELS